MELGVVVMPTDAWSDTVGRVQELEALGFDHVWIYDHLVWRHYRDRDWHPMVPWLAGLAASTSTIGLGTMVASPNLRHPLTLAKEAVSIDHISGGRLILGLGAGTAGFDAKVFGQDPLTPGRRVDRLDEYVEVVAGAMAGRSDDHRGRWYTIDGARTLPAPVADPRIPLAVAAGGSRALAVVAGRADRWITLGDTSGTRSADEHMEVVAEQAASLDDHCRKVGRDPADVGRIYFMSSDGNVLKAGFDGFVDRVNRVAALGFDTVVFHDHRGDDPNLDVGPDLIGRIAQWKAEWTADWKADRSGRRRDR